MRSYTAAMSEPLPRGAIQALYHPGQPGVYVCRVIGRLPFPLWLPVWVPRCARWEKRRLSHVAGCVLLHATEVPALQRLGLLVHPFVGWRYADYIDLRPLTRKAEAALAQYGRKHPVSAVLRLVVNALAGKLGVNPMSVRLRWSVRRPGPAWMPHVDALTDHPQLWERSCYNTAPYQLVHAAAEINARGRAQLLHGCAALIEAGARIVHLQVDSITATMPRAAPEGLAVGLYPGAWRQVVSNDRIVVVNVAHWQAGDENRLAA